MGSLAHYLRFTEDHVGQAFQPDIERTRVRLESLTYGAGRRRGVTLIELLVVISIMMLLVVMTVPAIRPATESRRIREAARAINVFLSAAQNRSVEGNRSFGVELQRDPGLVLGCRTLHQVEVPEEYCGETGYSRINFGLPSPLNPPTQTSPNAFTVEVQFFAPGTATPIWEDPVAMGFVRAGDELKLSYKGNRWLITGISPEPQSPLSANNSRTFTFFLPAGASLPEAISDTEFQVFRQPVRNQFPPLQLPRSVVVDLTYSFLQNTPLWPASSADTSSVVIMFNSRRAVDRVYARHAATGFYLVTRVSSPIYLLVGRRDRVNSNPGDLLTYTFGPNTVYEPRPVAEDGLPNIRDLKNLWVALNPQTGYAACTEVTAAGPVYWTGSPVLDTTGSYTLYDFAAARGLASQFRSMGGR